MRIMITGGSGLIGRELTGNLTQNGHEVIILSRTPARVSGLPQGARAVAWDGKTTQGWGGLIEETDAIVNLVGENLAGEGFFPSRWTEKRKRTLKESRILPGQAILEAIEAARHKPEVLVQSSAVGYYGPRGDEKLTEDNAPGDDFLARYCQEWESTTAGVEEMGVRRVVIRSGVVLSTKGGALPRILLPFKLYAGAHFGNGRQYMSWIHPADEIGAIRFLIENKEAQGVFNLTAPNPQTNAGLSRTIGKVMKRPYFLFVPGFALRLAFGEVTTVVLDGQRVLPKRLLDIGYEFQYPELEAALRDILTQ